MATMAETTGTPALSPSAEPGRAGPTMPTKPLRVDGALCALIDSKASTPRDHFLCIFFERHVLGWAFIQFRRFLGLRAYHSLGLQARLSLSSDSR
mgnify:CR=1 FL=1